MKFFFKIVILLLPIPLYFYLDGSIYNVQVLGLTQISEPVLSMSFILMTLFACFRLTTIFIGDNFYKRVNSIDFLLMASVSIMFISFLISSLFINNSFSINLLLIYLVPQLFGYIFGRTIQCYFKLDEVFKLLWFPTAIFCMLQVLFGLCFYGFSSFIVNRGFISILGFMSIYGIYIFYPALLSIILFIGICDCKINKTIKFIGNFFIMFSIIVSASREPWLLIFMMIIVFCLQLKSGSIKVMKQSLFFFVIVMILIIILSYCLDVQFPLIEKIVSMSDVNHDLSFSLTSGRYDIWQKFFYYISHNLNVFFFGSGFSLSEEYPQGTFHNQWFDLIAQGGFFYMISITFIFIIVIRYAHVISKKEMVYKKMVAILTSFVFISFFINTSLRTPYVSIILWLFIGFVSGRVSNNLFNNKIKAS